MDISPEVEICQGTIGHEYVVEDHHERCETTQAVQRRQTLTAAIPR
jgi:hypothetical protein